MFGALDTSTSALVANRQWLTVIANNLSNQNTTNGADEPYRAQRAIFATGNPTNGSSAGVHLQEIEYDSAPFVMKYEPNNKFADENGNVAYPNVNTIIEQMNAMIASRAYESNIVAAEATKSMMRSSLRLLA
jgi:flagellar basal-body rod protein FlgC